MSDAAWATGSDASEGQPVSREDGLHPCFKCSITKRKQGGFGFNIKGPTADGGQMLSVAGTLLPPLQYISAVEAGAAAWSGGLRVNDRVLKVNGNDAMGRSHTDIVDMVHKGGSHLEVEVLRISQEEAERMARIEEAAEKGDPAALHQSHGGTVVVKGYVEKSTPDIHTVYKIYFKGQKCTMKRFSEFAKLHKELKARFRWYDFPPFPKKQFNGIYGTLSDAQKSQRGQQLNAYMAKVMSNEDILSSPISYTFLGIKPPRSSEDASASPSPPPIVSPGFEATDADVNSNVDERAAEPSSSSQARASHGQKLFDEATVFDEVDHDEMGAFGHEPPGVEDVDSANKGVDAAHTNARKRDCRPKKVTGVVEKNVFDDDDDVPIRAMAKAAKAEKATKTAKAPAAAAAAAQQNVSVADSSEISVAVPGTNSLVFRVSRGATVAEVEELVASKLKLGSFASRAFGLFVLLEDGSVVRKLPPKRKVSKALSHGALVYRKWLFAKSQEVNMSSDPAAVLLLRHVNRDDIASGNLNAERIRENLAAAEECDDPAKYNRLVRKLRRYGSVSMRLCACDFPNEGSTVVVSLQLKRLVITQCDDSGSLSEDEEGTTEFSWESLTSWEPDDSGAAIVIKYTTEGDDTDAVKVELGDDVPYFSMCAKRIMLERDWITQRVSDDSEVDPANFFLRKA
mmetsp:Transcript_7734/g.22823  ORF Transcript_7734/g.22823 Transcript_7734/m.22823 type:complete len:683 (-) Transcript_7734:77-2125(-)